MNPFKTFIVIGLGLSILIMLVSLVNGASLEIELTGVADSVIDGDTFDITANNGTEYRIRLADINANELGEPGYYEARNRLIELVFEKTVYLDVDDLYIWDDHGYGNRLVAVPYVEHNATHMLNVCEALFRDGQVAKREYDNEFTPYSWDLYVLKTDKIPEFSITPVLVSAVILSSIIFLLLKGKFQNKGN